MNFDSQDQVHRIMNARSVAIYGASDDTSKWGGGLMHLLLRHGYQGRIYPINRKLAQAAQPVQGLRTYGAIGDIPEVVDVACVAVPNEQVSQVIGECADAGVAGCLVISSNFAETGDDGALRQQALVRLARERGTRLIGPNCMGLMNTHHRFNLCNSSASAFYDYMIQGHIGVVSQSGALMGTMLARAYACGSGLSSAISVGNQADLDICDFFDYLIADANTHIICLYIEGLLSPQRFRTLCQRSVAAGKPVLVVKAGRSESGAQAVQSHTGSLAGGYASLEAVCTQLGVQLMTDVIDMVDVAMAWSSVGAWREGGVAVMTASGGGGALAMDALEQAGFQLPSLSQPTRDNMARWLPPTHLQLPLDVGVIASHGAPQNILSALRECAATIMADPAVGAGIYVMTTQKYAEVCTQVVIETARQCGKPLFLVNQASEVGQGTSQAMREAAQFECASLHSATTVLHGLRDIGRTLARPAPAATKPLAPSALRNLLPVPQGCVVTLSEADTKALLAQAGLPVPRQGLARNTNEAIHLARDIGFPVVMKIDALGVTHKSDMGGVALDLNSEQAVAQAYERIAGQAAQHLAPGHMRGCLVQQSVPADVELIVGSRWDPQFGTMVVLGLGGTLVELLHDVRILPAPFTRAEVEEQLTQLQLYPLLAGYRGARPVDLERLIETIEAIGAFAAGLGERLLEFDANPVRVSGSHICIADARAVVI
ncbi:acetate--CoA ligase family protein [Hydrogenophaga sp. OTU3427]|uniref:acetate--CoA ligase family protein n=1 Tax=Hydrogenophaga sp. OTU3427 TaxID=3043856 RepID=UPI00313CCA90